jgi:hypothetical protein
MSTQILQQLVEGLVEAISGASANDGNLVNTGDALVADITATGFSLATDLTTVSEELIATGSALSDAIELNTNNLFTTGYLLTFDIEAVSGNLVTSGAYLTSKLIETGALLTTNLASTGGYLTETIVATGALLTTNLIATGGDLSDRLIATGGDLSDRLIATGSGLSDRLIATGAVMDQFDERLIATGSGLVAADVALSGNLDVTAATVQSGIDAIELPDAHLDDPQRFGAAYVNYALASDFRLNDYVLQTSLTNIPKGVTSAVEGASTGLQEASSVCYNPSGHAYMILGPGYIKEFKFGGTGLVWDPPTTYTMPDKHNQAEGITYIGTANPVGDVGTGLENQFALASAGTLTDATPTPGGAWVNANEAARPAILLFEYPSGGAFATILPEDFTVYDIENPYDKYYTLYQIPDNSVIHPSGDWYIESGPSPYQTIIANKSEDRWGNQSLLPYFCNWGTGFLYSRVNITWPEGAPVWPGGCTGVISYISPYIPDGQGGQENELILNYHIPDSVGTPPVGYDIKVSRVVGAVSDPDLQAPCFITGWALPADAGLVGISYNRKERVFYGAFKGNDITGWKVMAITLDDAPDTTSWELFSKETVYSAGVPTIERLSDIYYDLNSRHLFLTDHGTGDYPDSDYSRVFECDLEGNFVDYVDLKSSQGTHYNQLDGLTFSPDGGRMVVVGEAAASGSDIGYYAISSFATSSQETVNNGGVYKIPATRSSMHDHGLDYALKHYHHGTTIICPGLGGGDVVQLPHPTFSGEWDGFQCEIMAVGGQNCGFNNNWGQYTASGFPNTWCQEGHNVRVEPENVYYENSLWESGTFICAGVTGYPWRHTIYPNGRRWCKVWCLDNQWYGASDYCSLPAIEVPGDRIFDWTDWKCTYGEGTTTCLQPPDNTWIHYWRGITVSGAFGQQCPETCWRTGDRVKIRWLIDDNGGFNKKWRENGVNATVVSGEFFTGQLDPGGNPTQYPQRCAYVFAWDARSTWSTDAPFSSGVDGIKHFSGIVIYNRDDYIRYRGVSTPVATGSPKTWPPPYDSDCTWCGQSPPTP